MMQYELGMIGLGVMGRNFLLNMAEKGFNVAGYDKDSSKTDALKLEAGSMPAHGFTTLEEMVASLKSPKIVMMLVPAGNIVDAVIQQLIPLLTKNDIIIDGGNSLFSDTQKREIYLAEKGIYFLGTGISGGEEGARKGPSIMPGGSIEAYQFVKPIFEKAAAQIHGEPCVAHMGDGGAGHYVKMVHNGIEYGLMQLISETYNILKNGFQLTNDEIHTVFSEWNTSELNSFLIEITAHIFTVKDTATGNYLLDEIKDSASAKGTGKWTSQNAMDIGIPIPNIDTAVNMRDLSSKYDLRKKLSTILSKESHVFEGNKSESIEQLKQALYFAYIITYAQGMSMLAHASDELKFNFNLSTISKIWRGGCIIRSSLLEKFMQIFDQSPLLENILLDNDIATVLSKNQSNIRYCIALAMQAGIPVAGYSAALAYFDTLSSEHLPANLIQAQRDYFGSHTYERNDKAGIFHTEWTN